MMTENTQHTPVLQQSQLLQPPPLPTSSEAAAETLVLRGFFAVIFIVAGIIALNIGQNLLLEDARLSTAEATVAVFAGVMPITLGMLGITIGLSSIALFFYAYRLLGKRS
jgi:hypothetical protein